MLEKVLFPLVFLYYVATTKDIACDRNRTFLEVSGDVVLSVFVDANDGPYCNVSSSKGFREASTAVYVVQMLNKYDYVPGLLLGVKCFDTCHDEAAVYKQALMATVDLDCASTYDLGILVSDEYSSIMKSFEKYSALPISTYKEQNFTKALLDIMVNFTSTKFEVIDLFLTTSQFVLDHFLETSKGAGICVKSHAKIVEGLKNDEETVVVAVAGSKKDIRSWIENGEKIQGSRTIWIVLPLDGSYVDDLIPAGSYLIEAEPFTFDLLQKFSSVDNFLETTEQSVIHSPHLLGIGKAIVELAQVLRDLQKRTCPRNTTCDLPRFNLELPRREIGNIEVYEALRILPKSHPVRYVVMKSAGQSTLVQIARYGIDAIKTYVTSEARVPKMPGLCSKELSKNCQECTNFRKSENARNVIVTDSDKGFLKSGNLIAIYLAIAVCGTFACVVIVIFILYRFFMEDVLDGNPILTVFLALSTILVLQTVLLFCMDDEFAGSEHLNSRKIFLTTLSVGLIFSIMLSRVLFLAFSTSGLFVTHIDGYLQGLLAFFMAGVQIAISIMYLVLNRDDPVVIVRSMTFVALLGYDIFLLVKLFVVCCFIAQIQQNYREGKCFFGTVIGLVVTWGVWVTCFIFVETEMRDNVVCLGIIATSYLAIVGILIPRTYYMVANVGKKKDLAWSFGPETDLGSGPGMNSIAKQFKFYNYVIPTPSISNLRPNYYGSSSPHTRYMNRYRNPDFPKIQDSSNYGFDSEMREIENVYETPRIYYRNTEDRPNPMERSGTDTDRLQPYYPKQSNRVFEVPDCIETDIYVEGRPLPSPRGPDEVYPSRNVSPKMSPMEATIDEEDEDDEVIRITRF